MKNEKFLKFGQMVMIGLDTDEINDEIARLIKEYKIGGIVLYKKNYDSLESMISFINKLKKINEGNEPLFIAIDQENGRVNRLPNDIKRIYNAKRQADTGDLKVVDKCNEITTNILKNVGVNMNFAPVLDINRSSDDSDLVGNRGYGKDAESVIKYAIPAMKKMQEEGIIPVVKHFPGHGIVKGDSHYVIPVINDVKKMESEDLKVFDEAIKSGADAIMVGHLRIKGYDKKPATMNKQIINDYLIDKCKYDGLIVTDDLRMNTMKCIYGIKKVIFSSIYASCDVLMIKYKRGDIRRLYSKIYEIIENNEALQKRVDASYEKIIKIKRRYNLSNDQIINDIDLDDINKQIDEINIMM